VTAVVRDTEDAEAPEDAYERPVVGLTPRVLGAVALTGLVLTAVLYWRGFRWSAPLVPSMLSGLTGFLAIWLAAAVAVDLLHRHHRVMARHGLRAGRAGMLAGARYGGMGWRVVTATAAQRWAARTGEPPGDLAAWPAEPVPGPPLSDAQRERDAAGKGHICAACGHPGTEDDPPVIADGYRVHASHTAAPQDGFYDPVAAPAATAIEQNGDSPVNAMPARAEKRLPARGTPAVWRALVQATAEYEPETHEELLAWMAGEVAGMSALAEAYLTVYEHCRDVRKLDAAAIGALEGTSDAAMDCMTAMAYTRQKYAAVYEPVAEVAEGHDLPVDARGFFGPGEA
jgi:hypothetical protein